jgi:predicted lysophospholipase L1 biosynthesis ABC-type transport system permease subunit
VRRLFLCEATLLALIGVAVGSVLGLGYTRAVLAGLATIWRDAVGATALELHAAPRTLALGAGLALLASVASIALAFRAPLRRPAQELLSGASAVHALAGGRARASALLLAVALLACVGVIAGAGRGSSAAAGAFFGAGALLLVAGMAASRLLLARSLHVTRQTVGALGLRNTLRRPGRSLATIALLACGTFLVLSVGANRLGLPEDPRERASGTGGFTLLGNATLGVPQDLDTAEGREAFALDPELFEGVAIVPMRVRAGDDASCLNLSLPQSPRLFGVRAGALAERGAFTFAAVHGGHPRDGASPWSLLAAEARLETIAGRELPVLAGVGDQASVTWTLHKRPGDVIEYQDEQGRPFGVRIVATVASSILQGSLVIDERHFQERFPSESGYRAFLIDAPPERAEAVAAALTRGLSDVGLEVVPTAARLAELNAVQNTYLVIFQLLGALGLLLGSVGLGMVVLRNTLERRSELALLRAVGFGLPDVRRVVLSEHALLLALGLASGALAAMVALLPGLESGAAPSLAPVLAILVAITLNGALWVRVATALALRGPLLSALRRE